MPFVSSIAELPLFENKGLHGFTLIETESLIPARSPLPGEQYRFHFDMSKCIGCKCCVVACNEQNGNPAHINWRRVGEIEGGTYPDTQRWHMSMGCNHCIEPSCLIGCPVEAYTKNAATGIVDHNPDICIGCQYCTWNCSYGVPQFNDARGVVGKCDMCHGRLNDGLSPACVNACPEGAIAIEIVNISEWRKQHDAADAPGLPSADDSISTTRITLPKASVELGRVDIHRVRPDHPHWSLVFLLVLTQLSVGALGIISALDVLGAAVTLASVVLPLAVGLISLAAAPLHLGRPIHAYRAINNWRRSWLSREILTLSMFAGAASAYAAAMYFSLPYRLGLGAATVALGILGITSSAKIYMVPARPAWDTYHTPVGFYLTAAILGPLLALATGVTRADWVIQFAAAAALAQLANESLKAVRFARSETRELRGSASLLGRAFGVRFGLLALSGVLTTWAMPLAAFPLAIAGELMSSYLFFTTVVPKSVASTFVSPGKAAA